VGHLQRLGKPALKLLVSLGTLSLLFSEINYWRIGRTAGRIPDGSDCVLVVLGFPGETFAGRVVQRWRVDLAMRAWRKCGESSVIFTGGPTRSSISEASQMAAMAVEQGMDPAVIVLEENSRNTRTNVSEASRLVEGKGVIVIVSDASHAARARGYWREQNPDSNQRVLLADRYSFLDHFWLRTPGTLIEVLHSSRNSNR
jgi:uncharacterized SAM-binding protein YcdF (DUF218 family)